MAHIIWYLSGCYRHPAERYRCARPSLTIGQCTWLPHHHHTLPGSTVHNDHVRIPRAGRLHSNMRLQPAESHASRHMLPDPGHCEDPRLSGRLRPQLCELAPRLPDHSAMRIVLLLGARGRSDLLLFLRVRPHPAWAILLQCIFRGCCSTPTSG